MNGSEPRYNREYVELQTSLERIRTRLDHIDTLLREIHERNLEVQRQVEQNRADISGIKASAALLGGLAGSLLAVLSRLFFLDRS
jgi:chromosome segregation ATPase